MINSVKKLSEYHTVVLLDILTSLTPGMRLTLEGILINVVRDLSVIALISGGSNDCSMFICLL